MKMIFMSIFSFCMAILPLLIRGYHTPTKNLLDRIADSGGNIDNIFQPSKNGCLGQGEAGLIYRGILLRIGEEVAMKFIPNAFSYAESERNAYVALGAVNNTEKEAYGIPTLYHYGRWGKYYMIAITLFDSDFAHQNENNQLTAVDKLIVFRELVRITKYIHSRNICHGDPHLDNIMFRQHQGFLIDYNLAIEARKDSEEGIACAKIDWRKFLVDIASTFDIKYAWGSNIPINKFQRIQHEGLRRVFCEFAMTTYGEAPLNYNKLYKIINEEIERYDTRGSAIVSWLTGDKWLEACSDLLLNPIPSIESIH